MIRSLWRSEKLRFLVTGAFNTASSYLVFAALFSLLSPLMHYMFVQIIIIVTNVTISFITLRSVVFRSRGNVLREYLRFYLVYAIPISVGLILFPLMVEVLRVSPYLAQALILAGTVVVSYFGHKRITFQQAA